MKNKKIDIIIYTVLAAVLAHILWVYPSLPQKIPIHWSFSGEIDGWAGKSSIWLIYALVWFIHIMLKITPKIDPKKENYTKFAGFYGIFHLMMILFFAGLLELTIKASFAPQTVNMGQLAPIMTSLIIIFVGNYLPKCKQNYTFGIKTPWTLASESVWNKTHRFSGLLWVGMGLLSLAITLAMPNSKISTAISISTILLAAVLSCGYSYIAFIKENK